MLSRLLRAPALRVTGLVLIVLVAVVPATQCTKPAFSREVHTWGRYPLCLRRIVDACHAHGVDAGCTTRALDDSQAPDLGVEFDGGTFLWTRPGLPNLEGHQAGARFEIVSTTPRGASVCDCDADVRETIRGEFQRDPITLPTCTSAPDDPTGCAPGDGGMLEQQLFDGGLPTTDWLAGATGEVDPAAAYPSLRAWIVDEVTASDSSDGGCPCLPCRVEYEVQGRL